MSVSCICMFIRDIHCMQGCQLNGTGDVWGLGTLASTDITSTFMPDGRWALTALYSNPEQGKRFTVYYTVELSGRAPEFQFVTDETPSSVVSDVHAWSAAAKPMSCPFYFAYKLSDVVLLLYYILGQISRKFLTESKHKF